MKIEETIINVIFDAGRGNVTVSSREATVGKPLGTLPRPTRSGYSFTGWTLDGTTVTEETVLRSDTDIRLVAGWAKLRGADRKTSALRRRKIAIAILAAAVVVLSVTLAVVNRIVSIYGMTDTYYDAEGNECTAKYYIKKKNGVYSLYDRRGDLMEMNSDGYYITLSGNQYKVDASTGEYELYAVVDYDAAGGEVLGFSDRIMMFPQISQTNTFSIAVENQYGKYKLYRDKTGTVHIEGTEESIAAYDKTLFASLCVSCGYTLTMQKIDLSSDAAPRLADGSIDYSAYGLADVYDTIGNLTYTPAKYTVTAANYADDGTCTASDTVYTVKVGDAILSGAGYYVQRADRAAVYIVSSDIANTVLQPVEKLVTPMVVYPMSVSTYSMVYDFILGTMDFGQIDFNAADLSEELEKLQLIPITAFSYQDLAERENTMYSSVPYVTALNLMSGYQLNNDNVSAALGNLYQMEFISCKKLGITRDALHEYGLDGKVSYLTFLYDISDATSTGKGEPQYIQNQLIISEKTAAGTYYIASFLTDMIVEVDQYYLNFLEWEPDDWYYQYFFQNNIAYIKDIHMLMGDKKFDFTMDNSATDQSSNVSSDKMTISCEQYTGNNTDDPHLLDYTIHRVYKTDTGAEKSEDITAVSNFRQFYKGLLWFSIEGNADETVFKQNLGMGFTDYIAQGDGVCQAIIRYSTEDTAATSNKSTDKDGNPLYPTNNKRDVVIRFYRYTEGKTLLTIEVLSYDENGNPLPSDPTKAQGRFYVLSSFLEKLFADAERVVNVERVVTDSKN